MKKVIFLLLSTLLVITLNAADSDHFVIEINTLNDKEFTIPTNSDYSYNYNVDCENDGTIDATAQTGNYICIYPEKGTYIIRIIDNIGDGTGFPALDDSDKSKIFKVIQWGTGKWKTMKGAFKNAPLAEIDTTTSPDLSNVKDTSYMFQKSSFNSDIRNWDVSHVEDMSYMFNRAMKFNQDISSWNVEKVKTMKSMFQMAKSFNKPINWNVKELTTAESMFRVAKEFNQPLELNFTEKLENINYMLNGTKFNQDINDWDVSHVKYMKSLLPSTFNKPLDRWNVSKVENMDALFKSNKLFNQDISGWNVSSVISMREMFRNSIFDQNIGSWNISNVENMTFMFIQSKLSTENYDALLEGWSKLNLKMNVHFHAGNSTYCKSETAKQIIQDGFSWSIQDGGRYCGRTPDLFVITVKTDNDGPSEDTQFTIPTFPSESYNYDIDCDDDGFYEAEEQHSSYTCNYSQAGSYSIRIKDHNGDGTGFPRIYFSSNGDSKKLIAINQWGTVKWSSMERAFFGCENLDNNIIATDYPDLSKVESLKDMFFGATLFNQDISSWNVSNIVNMKNMFFNAVNFNQDIGSWNTAKVENMSDMFRNSPKFNQDIGSWNVSSVTDMSRMFWGASSFDQDLSSWNVEKVTDMENMFKGIKLSTNNYDNLLIAWNKLNLKNGVKFNAGSSNYCNGETARDNLTETDSDNGFSWIIKDGGKLCELPSDINLSKDSIFENSEIGSEVGIFSPIKGEAPFVYELLNSGEGSEDSSKFTIDNNKLKLNFVPDYENPIDLGDSANNNTYTIRVKLTDKSDNSIEKKFIIKIINLSDIPKNDFVIKVQGDSFTINIDSELEYNYSVDCDNDGIDEIREHHESYSCNYDDSGEHIIRIKDDSGDLTGFPRIFFKQSYTLLGVVQWGKMRWTSMREAFSGCTQFNSLGSDTPDLSAVEDFSYMFSSAINFNQDINSWNMENAKDLTGMFKDASNFNQSLNSWNIKNVTNMEEMFRSARKFNQPLNDWNVENVENMNALFYSAQDFNQPLDKWNVKNVKYMKEIFKSAQKFNQPLNSWNVENLEIANQLFNGASSFNQPLDNWNTSNITDMKYMFLNAISFDQNISSWNVEKVTAMRDFFKNVSLSTKNYDALLIAWQQQNLKSNIKFNAGNSHYCKGESARGLIIDNFSWEITDLGKKCTPTEINLDNNYLDENSIIGTEIATITAIDGNSPYSFELALGDNSEDNSKFVIIGDKLKSNFLPDYENPIDIGDSEKNNTYTIRIKVTDQSNESFEKSFIITVNDIGGNNECSDNSLNDCDHDNGTCTDNDDGYECGCLEDYLLNEETKKCIKIDNCKDSPCQNGGECIDGVSSYSCKCKEGYEGENCKDSIKIKGSSSTGCNYSKNSNFHLFIFILLGFIILSFKKKRF